MLELFFLKYVNNPFRKNPKNIIKVLNDIFPLVNDERSPDIMKMIINYLFNYYTCKKDKSYIYETLNMFEEGKKDVLLHKGIAFAAVYGYLNNSCEKYCRNELHYCYDMMIKHKENTGRDEELTCIDCEQIAFTNILSDIVSGISYLDTLKQYTLTQEDIDKRYYKSTIKLKAGMTIPFQQNGDMDWMIRHSYSSILCSAKLSGDEITKKDYIDIDKLVYVYGLEQYSDYRFRFNDFIRSLIGYSLVEFLLNNDRRRLKRCEECKVFYISKTLRPSKYCSDKCRLARHNREYILSGKAKDYKRRGRLEGKYQ